MAISRQQNWLSGGRADIPFFRSLESAICNDFDLGFGTILAGRKPLVVSGFNLISTGITLATQLQLQVAGSSLIHFYASESGSIYQVPADRAIETLNSTNPRLVGSFTPNVLNFLGIDLLRSADATTSDLVEFIDTATLTETPETVPLARTLDYRIVISATDFDATPGVVPIATIQVDGTLTITQIEDARNIFWRLGTGGTSPNPLNTFPWPNGRKEGPVTSDWTGGDKAITSLKGFIDAASTRLWELGGGEFWYSPTQDHNVTMARTGSPFVSSGEYFEWSGTNLHWKGLAFSFANSTAIFNTIVNQTADSPGLTNLADGECIFVDFQRNTNAAALTAQKTNLALLGSPTVPGSRWVLAWRYGANIYVRDQSYAVGSSFILATIGAAGTVKLSASDSGAISPPVVATVDQTTFLAYAAGITRGAAAGINDFIGGAGDIKIGGAGAYDHNIILDTFRAQDHVRVQGSKNYTVTQNSPLSVANLIGDGVDFSSRTLMLSGYNTGAAREEDAHHFYSNGGIGFRNVVGGVPPTPTPTANAPVRSILFFADNGVASPNKRDRICVCWADGSIDVILEGPLY